MCTSVQGFFLFRCWRIFQRRLLPLFPFLCLYLVTIITGFTTVVQMVESLTNPCILLKLRDIFAVWMISLFFLDLSMTTTTIVFLYRACVGHSGYDSVSKTVWHVVWASATPPLVITGIPMVNQFLVSSSIHPVTIFPVTVLGKLFVLSLMISLVGRGYIRENVDQLAKGPSLGDGTLGLGVRDVEQSIVPEFSHRASIVYEIDAVRPEVSCISDQASNSDAIQMQLFVKNPGDVSRAETSSAQSKNNKISYDD